MLMFDTALLGITNNSSLTLRFFKFTVLQAMLDYTLLVIYCYC
jgi:hypothetical protein